ncbi:MAG: response regulator [Zoogloea sp.]|uniref:response regulator n=1 Tax=Zoogloea sp. TaxID=49181 RepID=UPI003F3F6B26
MIRILLVEDHALVRNGYRRLLDAEADMQVVAEASSADEAYARVVAGGIDLAVVDLNLRGGSGIEAIGRMLARNPGLKVLVISMHDNPSFVTQAMRAGALGYLTKSTEPEEMLLGLRDVASGRRAFSRDVARTMASIALDGTTPLACLTPREFDVLRLTARGETPSAIASSLHLSQKTIHNHLSAIRQKLDADSDFKLLHLAARHGLLELSASVA